MSGKDFAIGVLTITATILFTGIVLMTSLKPEPAMAFGQTAMSGDYQLTTAQVDEITEVIYVLDAALQRLNLYGLNPDTNQIELIQQIDLQTLQLGPAERLGERDDR